MNYRDIWNVADGQWETCAEWKLHCLDYAFPSSLRVQINADIDARTLARQQARSTTAPLNKVNM